MTHKLIEQPCVIFDVDGVIANDNGNLPYSERQPYPWVADYLKYLKNSGFRIVWQTARYMREFNGNQEAAHNAGYRELVDWAIKHGLIWDEIFFGKCSGDFYVDDKAVSIKSNDGFGDWDHFINLIGLSG